MTRLLHAAILAAGIAAPFVWPAHTTQVAVLWIMVLFALTWDVMGGQMGYNSLGNILFFGLGMYVCAIVQIGMFYDVAEYTAAFGAIRVDFTDAQYFGGLAFGLVLGGLAAVLAGAALSWVLFGLRGPYFAIGTLGVALAAAELTGAWDYVGGGGGISMPVFPGAPDPTLASSLLSGARSGLFSGEVRCASSPGAWASATSRLHRRHHDHGENRRGGDADGDRLATTLRSKMLHSHASSRVHDRRRNTPAGGSPGPRLDDEIERRLCHQMRCGWTGRRSAGMRCLSASRPSVARSHCCTPIALPVWPAPWRRRAAKPLSGT